MGELDKILEKMPKRKGKFATIQVDPSVVGEFKDACESMPLSPSMSRVATGLVKWFSNQPQFVKTAVVAGIDSGLNAEYARLLDELAKQVRAEKRPTDRVVTSDQVKQRELEHARQQKQLVAPRK